MSRPRDKFRKYLSGSEKLKKKIQIEENINSIRGSFVKFLNKPKIDSDVTTQLHVSSTYLIYNNTTYYIYILYI